MKIKGIKGLMGLSMVCWTASLGAAVRYVTIDGTGDGSGWDNAMASFADAYAAAAADATKEAPGYVYVGAGMYRLETALALRPHVRVVGGHGGRTVFSGDNMKTAARAAFWSQNMCDATYVVKPGLGKTPVWNDDLTFNEPNPENAAAWYCTWYGYSPCNAGRGFVATDDIGEAAFENVTFTLFRYGTFQFAQGTLVLTNCTFVGDCCNVLTEDVASIAVSGSGSVDLADCAFVGCAGCLRLYGSGVSRIVRTTFRENSMNALIDVGDTHRVTVEGCDFRRNWSTRSNCALVKLASQTEGNLLADCRFADNCCMGKSYGAVYLLGATNRVLRCSFTGNRNSDWSCEYGKAGTKSWEPAWAACLYSAGAKQGEIRDCSFTGNALSLSDGTTADAALVCFSSGNGRTSFVNCSLSGNAVQANGTGVGALLSRFMGSLSFLHVIICDNSYDAGNGQAVPFYSSYNGGNDLATLFCNSVLDEAGHTGNPFRFLQPGKGAPSLYAFVVKGFDATYFTGNPAVTVDSFFTSAEIDDEAVTTKDGRVFRRLSRNSPYRRRGYPAYEDDSGVVWAYRKGTDKWLRFDTLSWNYSPSGVVVGETDLLCDARGEARNIRRLSLGAVNATSSGTLMLVR